MTSLGTRNSIPPLMVRHLVILPLFQRYWAVRFSSAWRMVMWSLGKKDCSFLPAFKTGREGCPFIRLLNSHVLVMDTNISLICMSLIVAVQMERPFVAEFFPSTLASRGDVVDL